MICEVQLEGRDARNGSCRRSDFCRKVRQCLQIVAQTCGLGGEAIPGELHAVAGIPGETNDNLADLDDLLGHVPAFDRCDGCPAMEPLRKQWVTAVRRVYWTSLELEGDVRGISPHMA